MAYHGAGYDARELAGAQRDEASETYAAVELSGDCAGAEKFHGSMVGHGNPDEQRCFQETKQLGNELARIRDIAGTRFQADVGIYFDQENWWAMENPGKPNNDLKYARPIEDFHDALHAQNFSVNFVFPTVIFRATR